MIKEKDSCRYETLHRCSLRPPHIKYNDAPCVIPLGRSGRTVVSARLTCRRHPAGPHPPPSSPPTLGRFAQVSHREADSLPWPGPGTSPADHSAPTPRCSDPRRPKGPIGLIGGNDMDIQNPPPIRSDHPRPLARLWNWLCRRARRPERNSHPVQQAIPPICYDME